MSTLSDAAAGSAAATELVYADGLMPEFGDVERTYLQDLDEFVGVTRSFHRLVNRSAFHSLPSTISPFHLAGGKLFDSTGHPIVGLVARGVTLVLRRYRPRFRVAGSRARPGVVRTEADDALGLDHFIKPEAVGPLLSDPTTDLEIVALLNGTEDGAMDALEATGFTGTTRIRILPENRKGDALDDALKGDLASWVRALMEASNKHPDGARALSHVRAICVPHVYGGSMPTGATLPDEVIRAQRLRPFRPMDLTRQARATEAIHDAQRRVANIVETMTRAFPEEPAGPSIRQFVKGGTPYVGSAASTAERVGSRLTLGAEIEVPASPDVQVTLGGGPPVAASHRGRVANWGIGATLDHLTLQFDATAPINLEVTAPDAKSLLKGDVSAVIETSHFVQTANKEGRLPHIDSEAQLLSALRLIQSQLELLRDKFVFVGQAKGGMIFKRESDPPVRVVISGVTAVRADVRIIALFGRVEDEDADLLGDPSDYDAAESFKLVLNMSASLRGGSIILAPTVEEPSSVHIITYIAGGDLVKAIGSGLSLPPSISAALGLMTRTMRGEYRFTPAGLDMRLLKDGEGGEVTVRDVLMARDEVGAQIGALRHALDVKMHGQKLHPYAGIVLPVGRTPTIETGPPHEVLTSDERLLASLTLIAIMRGIRPERSNDFGRGIVRHITAAGSVATMMTMLDVIVMIETDGRGTMGFVPFSHVLAWSSLSASYSLEGMINRIPLVRATMPLPLVVHGDQIRAPIYRLSVWARVLLGGTTWVDGKSGIDAFMANDKLRSLLDLHSSTLLGTVPIVGDTRGAALIAEVGMDLTPTLVLAAKLLDDLGERGALVRLPIGNAVLLKTKGGWCALYDVTTRATSAAGSELSRIMAHRVKMEQRMAAREAARRAGRRHVGPVPGLDPSSVHHRDQGAITHTFASRLLYGAIRMHDVLARGGPH